MSAWIVSKRHIDALVHGLMTRGIEGPKDLPHDLVGEALWRENHRSIRARYGRHDAVPEYSYSEPTPMDVPYGYDAYDPTSVLQLIKLIHCYDYQTCEHSGWESSDCKRWMDDLERALVVELGFDADLLDSEGIYRVLETKATYEQNVAYERAPWGI